MAKGIIRAVGEPQRKIPAAQCLPDLDAVENVIERRAPHLGAGVPQRTILINLILKHVGVDGPRPHSVRRRQFANLVRVRYSMRQIPQHVQRDGWTDARPSMHLRRIAEFFIDGGSRRGLKKFTEARARIGETPRRQLDMEPVERFGDEIGLFAISHGDLPPTNDDGRRCATRQTIMDRKAGFCIMELPAGPMADGSNAYG